MSQKTQKILSLLLAAVLVAGSCFGAGLSVRAKAEGTPRLEITVKRPLYYEYDGYDSWQGYYYFNYSSSEILDAAYYDENGVKDQDFELYYVEFADDQSADHEWGIGRHTVTATYEDASATVELEVVSNPIVKMDLWATDTLIENYSGNMWEHYDGESDEPMRYFHYKINNDLAKGTLTLKNGYQAEVNPYRLSYEDDQDFDNPWGLGKHTVTATYQGFSAQFEVEVVKNPIKSISARQIRDLIKGVDDRSNYYDPYTGDKIEYNRYDYLEAFEYTISFTDGTPDVTGPYSDVSNYQYKDDYNNSIRFSDTQEQQPWSVGINKASVTLLGKTFEYDVKIIETPVKSVTVSNVRPISAKWDAAVTEQSYYDEETEEYYYESVPAFRADSLSFDFTVNMKDGSKKTYSFAHGSAYGGFSLNSKQFNSSWRSPDCYIPENGNQLTFTYLAVPFTVTFPVEDTNAAGDTFEYIEQNGAAYITDYYGMEQTVTVPATIKGLPVAGVQSLCLSGGNNVAGIEKLVLPDSVKSLSADALKGLTGLREIVFGKGVKNLDAATFEQCDSLSAITVSADHPDYKTVDGALYDKGVTRLIAYPLSKARSVTYQVPATVSDFSVYIGIPYARGYEVAADSSNFIRKDGVLYSKDMTVLLSCDKAKAGDYVMPGTVEEIFPSAFSGCDNLTSVSVSDKVTEIVYETFYFCTSLKKVTLPSSVKKIGLRAFENSGLEQIDLSAVTGMEADAFAGTALQSAKLSSLNEIPAGAFYRSSLTTVAFSSALTKIGNSAFRSTKLQSVALPDSLTEMDGAVFSDCENLKQIGFGKGLASIPYKTFFGCKALTSLSVPATVREIGDCAFANCGLKDVTVENGDAAVCRSAFMGCPVPEIRVGGRIRLVGTSAEKNAATGEIYYPDTVTDIVYGEFWNRNYNDYLDEEGYFHSFRFPESYNSIVLTSLPTSVKHIGAHAFDSLPLEDAENGSVYIGDALIRGAESAAPGTAVVRQGTRILADCAFENSSVKELSLPEGVEILGKLSLTGITLKALPATLKFIDSYALYQAELQALNLPKSLTELADYAFIGLKTSKLTVDKDNPAFTLADGVLYTKDMTELVYCPPYKTGEVHIPSTVRSVRPGAFYGCDKLTAVYITSRTTGLPENLFGNPTGVSVSYNDQCWRHYVNTNLALPMLFVEKDSAAEQFAKAAGMPFTLFESPTLRVDESETVRLAEDNMIRVRPDVTAKNLLASSDGSRIVDAEGKPVPETQKIGTGMVLQKLADGKVVDELTIVLPGDIEGNGEVEVADARYALRAAVGLDQYADGSAGFTAADTDASSEIEVSDARNILRAAVGLDNPAEWENA